MSGPGVACSRSCGTRSVFSDYESCQPKIRGENTSVTNATYMNPVQVRTQVRSKTHRWFGSDARNRRSTRSRVAVTNHQWSLASSPCREPVSKASPGASATRPRNEPHGFLRGSSAPKPCPRRAYPSSPGAPGRSRREATHHGSTELMQVALRRPVGTRSELQRSADRLDSETIPMRIDVHHRIRWPSSSAAKRADAEFEISFAL